MFLQTFGEVFENALFDPRIHFTQQPVQPGEFFDLVGVPVKAAFGTGPVQDEIGMPTPWAEHNGIIAQDESISKQDM